MYIMNGPEQLFRLRGNQQNSLVYHTNDGFFFHLNRTYNGTRYFRCTEWRNSFCPTTGKVSAVGVFSQSGHHNHGANIGRVIYQRARIDLIDQFSSLNVATVQDVFTNPRNFNIQQQFPTLTAHRLYPSMMRARGRALPRIQNLVELNGILQDDHYLCLTSTHGMVDSLYRGSVQCGDGSCVIVLLSKRCQEFLEMMPFVMVLSTEVKVLNNQYKMLITIACEWERNIIELAWLLMENDISDENLVRAFEFLKSCLRSCKIREAICGSKKISDAFALSFDVRVSQSLYDYIQWLKQISLDGEIGDNPNFHSIIRYTAALPLLPKDLTQHGIEIIIEEAHRTGVYDNSLRVFNQIETQWLDVPGKFSVFGSHLRTNYGIQDKTNKLKQHFSNNPNFYNIVQKIMTRVQKTHQQIQCFISGQNDGS